jgi:hypothetical protein
MKNNLSFAFIVGGIALMIFGFNASNSFGSDVSRFFTGNPTDRAMWMLLGGIASFVVGSTLLLRSKSS